MVHVKAGLKDTSEGGEEETYAIEVDSGADAETRPGTVQNQNIPSRVGTQRCLDSMSDANYQRE